MFDPALLTGLLLSAIYLFMAFQACLLQQSMQKLWKDEVDHIAQWQILIETDRNLSFRP